MAGWKKAFFGWLIRKSLGVRAHRTEGLRPVSGGLLVIANHEHPQEWLTLAPFLPDGAWFALHPREMPPPWLRRVCFWLRFVELDPLEPDHLRPLAGHLRGGGVVALFPSGGGLG